MATLTAITSCAATECAFNNDGCTAGAITVGGTGSEAKCTTMLTLDARGGLPVADGRVGACQRIECVFNKDLMCTSPTIAIDGDTANCTSYRPA